MFRTLSHVMLCMLLILSCAYTTKAQCPASTPLVINSVTTTESRCKASGTATVSVSGGSTPYTFSINAGPALTPPQSSNILQSLEPGTYTVQVTDNCATSVTRTFTITGSYTLPVPTITTQSPSCIGSSDGSITFNVTNNRPPYTYSLIAPSTVTRSAQASNVFTGLPAGTYTCQVTDSCGNFQTRTVSVSAVPSAVALNGYKLQYLACDSFAVEMFFNLSNYKPPYTITATLPDGSVATHVITAPPNSLGIISDTFRIRLHHITGAYDQMPVTITNQCGVSSTNPINLSQSMDMQPIGTLPSGCSSQYTYTFDDANFSPPLHCSTVTYTLISPTGAVLATQNNSSFSGYPPGTGYKVIREDCCRKDSLIFNWDAPPPFKINYTQNLGYAPCREGATTLFITYNYTNRLADIVLASGPPSVTFGDGIVRNYTYPDTTKNVGSGAGIGYFGPGTYKIYAIDECGNIDSITKTFTTSDVRHSTFTATLVKGCSDDNKILLNASADDGANVTVNSIYNKPFRTSDSLTGVPAGTYYATYTYQDNYYPAFVGMPDPGCDVIKDTIVIPIYKQPLFSSSAAVALCGSTRQVALLPDSTSGVAPYQYQIAAGAITTPLQTSPVFTGLAPGTYTFLMADACSNSYSRSMTIDTLTMPNVVTSGSTCVGSSATFTLPASPFFSYTWLHPDGSTSTGNTLTISSVKISDTGTYKVSVTSTIGGCTNTMTKSYQLSACQTLAETLLRFNGQWKNGNIQLSWQTADEINMSRYIVERSTDGFVFTPVQQTEAKGGELNTYTMTDTHVPSGIVYYRLQSVEKGGSVNYSSVISFKKTNTQLFNVSPTLITGNTPVTVSCTATSHAAFIRVVGADGKVWQTVPVAAGLTNTSIDLTSLPNGSYFIVFSGNDNVVTTKVWKE